MLLPNDSNSVTNWTASILAEAAGEFGRTLLSGSGGAQSLDEVFKTCKYSSYHHRVDNPGKAMGWLRTPPPFAGCLVIFRHRKLPGRGATSAQCMLCAACSQLCSGGEARAGLCVWGHKALDADCFGLISPACPSNFTDGWNWCLVPDGGFDAVFFAGLAIVAMCLAHPRWDALIVLFMGGWVCGWSCSRRTAAWGSLADHALGTQPQGRGMHPAQVHLLIYMQMALFGPEGFGLTRDR